MAIVGGYTLDLYCDNLLGKHDYNEFPHQVTGETGSSCRRRARAKGWLIRRDWSALCPKCNPKHRIAATEKKL